MGRAGTWAGGAARAAAVAGPLLLLLARLPPAAAGDGGQSGERARGRHPDTARLRGGGRDCESPGHLCSDLARAQCPGPLSAGPLSGLGGSGQSLCVDRRGVKDVFDSPLSPGRSSGKRAPGSAVPSLFLLNTFGSE